jgi:hypothetical protein
MSSIVLGLALLGSWFQPFLGVGTYREGNRSEISCEELSVELRPREENRIQLLTRYICGGIQIGSPTGILEQRGGELWAGGRLVGEISEDKFSVEILDGTFVSRFTGERLANGSMLWLDVRETPTRRTIIGGTLNGSPTPLNP